MKRLIAVILLSSTGWMQLQAQIAEKAVKQFKLWKNISYRSLSSGANIFTGERSVDSTEALLAKQPDGSWTYKTRNSTQEKWYYDHKRVTADLQDQTYRIENDTVAAGSIYLPTLAYIMDRLAADLAKGHHAITLPDSVIAGRKFHQFRVIQLDSMKKDKKIYSAMTFVLDKKTLLPYAFRQDGLGFIDGTDMYVTQLDEYTFFNYQLNQKNFPDISASMVPEGFTVARPKEAKDLLQKGQPAPEIDLVDMNGEQTKLSDYKGKVVLVSFTDNGCGYCAMSVGPSNEIYTKYKNQHFALININPFDSPDAIRRYNERYKVNFDSYKPGKSAVQDYFINGYPNFYIIDKEGKIAKRIDGYSPDLEKKLAEAIDSVL